MIKLRVAIWGLVVGLFLWGCVTPEIYHVAIRYEPGNPPAKVSPDVQKRLIVVTMFLDRRDIDDPVKIGQVLRPGGKKVHVLPEHMLPCESVTESVTDFFRRLSCSVAGNHPSWDLQEATIDPSWGDIIIGGTIEQMEIICDDSSYFSPVKEFKARVRLAVTIADGKDKRILYRTQAEATNTLRDISFSQEKMEKQINSALSEVIEKLFADYLRKL